MLEIILGAVLGVLTTYKLNVLKRKKLTQELNEIKQDLEALCPTPQR